MSAREMPIYSKALSNVQVLAYFQADEDQGWHHRDAADDFSD